MVQDAEVAQDALRRRSLSTKEPLFIWLFFRNWPVKIRHRVYPHHSYPYAMLHE